MHSAAATPSPCVVLSSSALTPQSRSCGDFASAMSACSTEWNVDHNVQPLHPPLFVHTADPAINPQTTPQACNWTLAHYQARIKVQPSTPLPPPYTHTSLTLPTVTVRDARVQQLRRGGAHRVHTPGAGAYGQVHSPAPYHTHAVRIRMRSASAACTCTVRVHQAGPKVHPVLQHGQPTDDARGRPQGPHMLQQAGAPRAVAVYTASAYESAMHPDVPG